jgi:WD40 repeat protein
MSNMDKKNRSIDEIKALAETEALSKKAKHNGNEENHEEKSDDASSLNPVTVKCDNSSSASASSNPPTAAEIAAVLQSPPGAFFYQMAATVLETGVDGNELMKFLQSKSKWLPVSLIVEHILPLLDRVSRNRLCSTYKELHAASRKVTPPWPFKRRLHTPGQRGSVYSVAFSPDSELLASGGVDRIIRICDWADGLAHR